MHTLLRVTGALSDHAVGGSRLLFPLFAAALWLR
jgi:hypothetical protein